MRIWSDALSNNPRLIRDFDFSLALLNTLTSPFSHTLDGVEPLILETYRAADIFFICHPEAQETKQLKYAYQVLSNIGPRLEGLDRYHFVNSMHSLFSKFGNMAEYAMPLLEITLLMARSVLSQPDGPNIDKSYTQRTINTLESIKNNTYHYPYYEDLASMAKWTHYYNANLSRYPLTPYR